MAENQGRPMLSVSLEDKYTCESGRIFLTGVQALTLLPMLQRRRDLAAGLNTAGYISGYRGSPLGGLDYSLWQANQHLARHHVVFRPGVNEDLAATAIWGTQQVNLSPGAQYDGVFGLWYGKGPGVDRCGDVFKHANSAGTAGFGGVIAVAGDDHAARSSTVAHQSEHAFKAAMMPVLAPSGVQEYLDLGLHAWALSRYAGCWVGFKALADTVESSATVDLSPERPRIVIPDDYELPADGLNIRWPDDRLDQEARLLNHKLYAALAYCRANRLNRIVIDSPHPRLGIISAGKSYLDVRQALDDLGIDEQLAAAIGIRLYKVGMVWPLEADGVRKFAEGLEEILVVEEKRQLIEYQLKEALYNWRDDVRPRVVGKFDETGEWALLPQGSGTFAHGAWLLPAAGELTPALIAKVIAARLGRFHTSPSISARLKLIEAREHSCAATKPMSRLPWFCPGCPHNTSTRVPEGSRALAGIGCHFMVTWMDRNTETFSHMGGEGAAWIGQAPFTTTPHVFVNLGDGTYFHSGVLAIRAAVAAGVNITYKILYNDAVAMTGGQPVDGTLTVPQIAHQLRAEGVQQIVVVIDDSAERAWHNSDLPHGIPVRPRAELDTVQRECRACPGVSAIIYDQVCAAEKRRRRKRGKLPDPPLRAFINEHVCEGCGDCGVQSNCLAVVPVETPLGRKRAIDQSACNKDYSCVNGFCPSFVTVAGGKLRSGGALAAMPGNAVPPAPTLPDTSAPYGILVTGVGGTGVVTLGALLGMAAHIDGKGATVLDMAGLAQKGGAVFSHVRICTDPQALHAVRITTGAADAVIGGDAIVSAGPEALAKMQTGRTRAVINSAATPTAAFTTNPDWQFPQAHIEATLAAAIGPERLDYLDAATLAMRLLGHTVYANLLLLGFAWQRGLLPVSEAALTRAIELNGTAVEMNLRAFLWGRHIAHDPACIRDFTAPHAVPPAPTFADLVDDRARRLTEYQDAALATHYRALVERVGSATAKVGGGDTALAETVARNYFKLLAIKDEYEVARLYAETDFLARVAEQFEGDYRLRFHLAPPLLARPDPSTGHIAKLSFGPWMMTAFKWLARARRWRGTRWDLFGRSAERRQERQLIADYEDDIRLILERLDANTLPAASALANWPEEIRGFGPVKAKNIQRAQPRRESLRACLSA
ncbi:MAG: indolepyruvate ferredoxin oxidoreductase family protein [Gammaproteobacteria bacterium]|nr:indolepyruvate ferredoxin oxidoreductase family protein [Rhodocyclaceae bacterium]MBU3910674.1 indolepyruvate ferredoxin oxidoreductase family protein [Gammaproteobacteria bacterium]MBU3989917.1 indolepyruvate ferredoxin oxidoreductase family protein [Gammaproteobacteria bacterium]MBU4005136.1 indolepyruvate ferredoxin oxidoreductase family protein [Gammaproteobacteria bacterium]MBU4021028.1 indolepyruvate ferredoxin oxidoreductase family protein [Gammaproteobacteria bacterium]